MATSNININNTEWTQVVPSAGKGLVSNPLGLKAYVRQASSQPGGGVTLGHPLSTDQSLNVDLSAGTDALYARVSTRSETVSGDIIFTAS